MSISKDELVQLLRNGEIEKFNSLRPFDETSYLDLTEIDLNDINLSGANLSRVDLSGSDLSQSELENVDFNYSDLSSVNFSHSTITDSNFIETILEGSVLNNSRIVNGDLADVNFNGVNACAADFSGADLSATQNLMKSVFDAETVWPEDDCLPDDFDPQADGSIVDYEDEEFEEEVY